MAMDKKISELPVLTGIGSNDISVLVNNGIDYQFSISLLLQYLTNNLSSGASIAFGTILPQNNIGKNGDVFVKTNTGQFAQKTSGIWIIVYTLPETNAADGTILYGSGLPGNSVGKNGDTYINTLNGIFYLKNVGSWLQVFSMQTGPQGPRGETGETGEKGLNGKSIFNGTINPSNLSTGTDGDFYINTNTLSLFGPKSEGVWGKGVPLINYTMPATVQFEVGGDNLLMIPNWQENYFADFGNAEFLVQLSDDEGNLNDRPDLSIKRIIDRSGNSPIQTAVSLDYPFRPNGQIIIKHSNFPLL